MEYHNIEDLPNGKYTLSVGNHTAEVEVTDEGYFLDGEQLSEEDVWNISQWEEGNVTTYKPMNDA